MQSTVAVSSNSTKVVQSQTSNITVQLSAKRTAQKYDTSSNNSQKPSSYQQVAKGKDTQQQVAKGKDAQQQDVPKDNKKERKLITMKEINHDNIHMVDGKMFLCLDPTEERNNKPEIESNKRTRSMVRRQARKMSQRLLNKFPYFQPYMNQEFLVDGIGPGRVGNNVKI